MSEKVLGYLLLGIGIFVMLFAVGYVWLVFMNKITPVQVIEAKSIQLDFAKSLGSLPGALSSSGATSAQSLPAGGKGLELFSGQDMSKTINLSITFFMMTFVMLFGFRIASLGVMLMRPIVVKLKEAGEPEPKDQINQNTTGTSS